MRLLLVDGSYYAYRSFYAMPALQTSEGKPTNALYGLTVVLRRMLADLRPTLAGWAMDDGLCAERVALCPEYKANRPEMPKALSAQLDQVEELMAALGIPVLRVAREEADDVMASYTAFAVRQGGEVILATSDKDMMSLVSPRVSIYRKNEKGFHLLTEPEITEKWGVPPAQIPDLLALIGDSTDNIAGIAGVGRITAAEWLRHYGSLEELLREAPQAASAKLRQLTEVQRERILRNRRMVGLRTDLPLPVPLDALAIRPDLAKQAELFHRWEFRKLAKEAEKALAAERGQPELFPKSDA
ncbi:5'-3' exonuclease [Methylacidimicrobium tartarophylax]|uniref:DNA polymerase I n=1 Tax=Methylacidimicrobium tartarophylax TaxID=1041768 RepID=A0A5E6MH55_9BACT|nr:5'-3' exonuclease H3TH domain-containing protein [Methylacidimicrobium tartarophylax]VVM07693.1 DNA polymerase I [Methylacidimicrobium tartarophylax]